jgi:group II intron reverse transcriptase/maturase
MSMGGAWLIQLDIRSYFDTVDHGKLREIVRQRIRDGVLLRLIGKWLKAGVLEDGEIRRSDAGTPQGGVISPLLANIFLHEVLDTWFQGIVKPHLRGRSFMVRYCDDAVLAFSSEEDARRVLAVLHKRFAKYGLELHPEKTRIVQFQFPKTTRKQAAPKKRSWESFNFLGFTHYFGRSVRGRWTVKVKTAKDRFARACQKLNAWLSRVRHWKIREQHRGLTARLRGHFEYYGVTFNIRALQSFLHRTERVWFYWLRRRSQRRHNNWEWFVRLLDDYPLPRARIRHSYVAKP